jgi:V/A-type H+-transporting ATPase subunit B
MIPDLLRHTNVLGIVGAVLKVRAAGIEFGDLAVVENCDGRASLAQVIELVRDAVLLQVFSGSEGLSTRAKVKFLGHPMRVTYSPSGSQDYSFLSETDSRGPRRSRVRQRTDRATVCDYFH